MKQKFNLILLNLIYNIKKVRKTINKLPYNPYSAHRALSELEFPIGNIYCIIPKERTPQPLQLSIIAISISYEVGQEQKAIFFVVILKQFDTKDLSNHQEFFFLIMKRKNSYVFLV